MSFNDNAHKTMRIGVHPMMMMMKKKKKQQQSTQLVLALALPFLPRLHCCIVEPMRSTISMPHWNISLYVAITIDISSGG
jgi:hypothetical protein